MENLEELTFKLEKADARALFVIGVATKKGNFHYNHDTLHYTESLYRSAIRASEILELDGLKEYFSTELMKHYVVEEDFRLAAPLAKQLKLKKEAIEYYEKNGDYGSAADIAKEEHLGKKARKLYRMYVQQCVSVDRFEEAIETTKKENLGGLNQIYAKAIEYYTQRLGWFDDAIKIAKEAGWDGRVLEIQQREIDYLIGKGSPESAIQSAKETGDSKIVLSTYTRVIAKKESYVDFDRALRFSRDAVDFCTQKGLAATEFEEKVKIYSAMKKHLS